jgi:hypothetical protein
VAYKRKTHTEYDIQGYYGYGWETVSCEMSRLEAKEQLRCYRENEPQYPHRIKPHYRVPNEPSQGV